MLRLLEPSFAYESQVMAYKRAFLASGDDFDGCAGLESCGAYTEWLDFDRRLRQAYGEGYVPSKVYLAVREEDDTVVGIIDCRQRLSEFLLRFGGHIGYSVLPSQRRKGLCQGDAPAGPGNLLGARGGACAGDLRPGERGLAQNHSRQRRTAGKRGGG